MVPKRSQVSRMVRRRSACVLLAGDEAHLAHAGELLRAETVEAAVAGERRAEERGGAGRVAPHEVEDEALEVAGLADVHRRAGGLEGLGARAHAVGAAAEELVEHVVLVGGHHQLLDRQAHHARHMAGADVAEVAQGTAKLTRGLARSAGVAWK
jgi:hypothetical protein